MRFLLNSMESTECLEIVEYYYSNIFWKLPRIEIKVCKFCSKLFLVTLNNEESI